MVPAGSADAGRLRDDAVGEYAQIPSLEQTPVGRCCRRVSASACSCLGGIRVMRGQSDNNDTDIGVADRRQPTADSTVDTIQVFIHGPH